MKRLILQIIVFLVPASGILMSQSLYNDYPIHRNSNAIIGWAKSCTVKRGPVRIDDPSAGFASFGSDSDATGPADGYVVSLGDGGMAICTLNEPASNKPGPDFAIFENSFDGSYLELAFAEVSTDSIRWVRLPSWSGTHTDKQISGFETINPSLLHNLAGKYESSFGTLFDLEEISDSTGIDINAINHIRIVDVVGSVDPAYGSRDSRGNIINDPWPTPFPQSGFDLDAVAVVDGSLVKVEKTSSMAISMYPVPSDNYIVIETGNLYRHNVRIVDITGRPHGEWSQFESHIDIDVSGLASGIYLAVIRREGLPETFYRRFIKK